MIRCSWERTLLLTKEENGKRVRVFASRRENCALCQGGREKGCAPPRAKNPPHILVGKEKMHMFNADEIMFIIIL